MTSFDFAPAPQRIDGHEFVAPPIRTVNKKVCHRLAQEFFKGALMRARERKTRIHDLEAHLQESSLPTDQERLWIQSAHQEAKYLRLLRTTPSSFTPIKTLAKGHSHDLTLVRSSLGNRVYVLKRIVKQDSDARGYDPPILFGHADAPASPWLWSHNNSDKDQSEWITTLYTTYVDNISRCELSEFIPGGDLLSRLIKHTSLSENTTRLLAAEILTAIHARHMTSYTYGNIKPENILIDRDGHIKLSTCEVFLNRDQRYRIRSITWHDHPRDPLIDNWDPAEMNNRRRYRRTIVHSDYWQDSLDYVAHEYFAVSWDLPDFAPEADWWALGMIIYECLVGRPPFFANNTDEIGAKLESLPYNLTFPPNTHLSPESFQLLRSLLSPKQDRPKTYDDITSHPFFAGIDFTTLRQGPGPFPPPNLTSDTDTSYYPPEEFILPDHELRRGKGPAAYWDMNMDVDEDTEIPEFRLPFLGPHMGHSFKFFERNLS